MRAYASLYLQQEVQAEALVRDVGAFARFLEAISFSDGSLLNLAEVARECQVGRKTVEGYLEILEDLLLSFRVPVFTRRAQRHLVAHDKFFFFDAGVYPWTVIRMSRRDVYMKALEAASVKGQITPLAEFIVQEMHER